MKGSGLHFLPCPEDFLQMLWELLDTKPLCSFTYSWHNIKKQFLSVTNLPIAKTVGSCPLYISSSYPAPVSPTLFLLDALSSSTCTQTHSQFSPPKLPILLIPSQSSSIFRMYSSFPGFFLPSDPPSSCTSLLHHLLLQLCPSHPIALFWIQSHLAVSFPCTKPSAP